MSIWGKIVGGAAGFALGGPLGALLGGLAGHAIDKIGEQAGDEGDATKQIGFTIGVIVLGAKMAKADGRVTRSEIDAFKEVFHIPQEELANVGRLFNRARQEAGGYEPYARQLARLFRNDPQVLEELLGGLFHIAKADGQVTEGELRYLGELAAIFGFDQDAWDRIRAAHIGPDQADPYRILGVGRDASDEAIKSAYRRLVRENHPDRLVAQGLPEEFVALANEKLAVINGAYDQIKKQRQLD